MAAPIVLVLQPLQIPKPLQIPRQTVENPSPAGIACAGWGHEQRVSDGCPHSSQTAARSILARSARQPQSRSIEAGNFRQILDTMDTIEWHCFKPALGARPPSQ